MRRFVLFLVSAALTLMGSGVTAAYGQALPAASPFLPAAGDPAAAAVGAKYQLGGIIMKGADIMVSVTRMSDKQSFWIPVGGTVNEITVLGCNADRDEATIQANGERLSLTLRKSVVQSGTGSAAPATAMPAATPPLPPPVGPPEVQEREARMLVTDLLEIGQQHRKAYEEAQRKAAAEKKK